MLSCCPFGVSLSSFFQGGGLGMPALKDGSTGIKSNHPKQNHFLKKCSPYLLRLCLGGLVRFHAADNKISNMEHRPSRMKERTFRFAILGILGFGVWTVRIKVKRVLTSNISISQAIIGTFNVGFDDIVSFSLPPSTGTLFRTCIFMVPCWTLFPESIAKGSSGKSFEH